MLNINKAIIAGNLGGDPETRYFPDGTAICTYRVATTLRYKDKKTQQTREITEWHTVKSTGKRAEIDAQYLRKGSGVYVEGRLRTDVWEDRETGKDRYATYIAAQVVQFTGPKPKDAPADQPPMDDDGGYYSDDHPA